MAFYSILLIGSWVIMAGIIAYTGNWVGRRLGKQRLSLFGLRPRYTATIFTIIAGMLIAGLTVFALSCLSTKVHIALTRVDTLMQDQETLRRENKRLGQERVHLQDSLRLVRELKKKSDADLKTSEAATRKAQEKSKKLTEEIRIKGLELNAATHQTIAAKMELNKTQLELKKSELKLSNVNKDLTLANAQFGKAAKQALLVGKENIQLYINDLLYKTRKVIYHPGEEINRGVIHAHQSPRQIQNEMIRLVASGGIEARKHGAADRIAGPAIVIPAHTIEGHRYNQEQWIAELAKQISESKVDIVARVMALYNSVEGQQVMVDFEMKPNILLYRQGDEIASKVFDSNESEAELLEQLVYMLKTKVRDDARQRGIIPCPDIDNGSYYESIGNASYTDLLTAVERIKKSGRLTRVRFRAAQDTWAIGPLNVDFQVVEEHSVGK